MIQALERNHESKQSRIKKIIKKLEKESNQEIRKKSRN